MSSAQQNRTQKPRPSEANNRKGRTLSAEAARAFWPTTTTTDYKRSGAAGYPTDSRHSGTTLTDAAVRGHGHPAPGTSTVGKTGSPLADLNPLFCEALMGFAADWTSPSGSSESKRSVIQSSPSVPRSSGTSSRRLRVDTNIRHSSETVEAYTPGWLVDKARYVTGGFDLDPASCAFANEVVRAERFYGAAENGLLLPWGGRLFLNPPGGLVDAHGRSVFRKSGGREGCTVTGACGLPPGHAHDSLMSSAAVWWRKLTYEWEGGRTTAAFFVGFSLELLQSAQGLGGPQPLDFTYCVPEKRIRFDLVENGVRVSATSPTHSNILVLVGGHEGERSRFREAFDDVGYVRT
mgnify:FL=1